MSVFRQYQQTRPQKGVPELDLLPPDRARRRIERTLHQPSNRDVVDADFVVIRDPPRARGAGGPDANPVAQAKDHAIRRLMSVVVERFEQRLQTLSERGFATLVASCFVLVFLFVAVQALRFAEHPEIAARPLDFTHVNLTPQDRNGMRVLLVNAIVQNRSSRSLTVPLVRADLLVDGQIVASTYIEPASEVLEAGRSRGLSARVQHPGGKTPELRLSFEESGASRS
ncbi:hypothetical protein ACSV9I_12630 [Rhizobium sp. G187]|uniref:hypothetical protein n=1 Tax=Rhizobium sp. G187 TaxID=3451352 RepID=UPI003EE73AB4